MLFFVALVVIIIIFLQLNRLGAKSIAIHRLGEEKKNEKESDRKKKDVFICYMYYFQSVYLLNAHITYFYIYIFILVASYSMIPQYYYNNNQNIFEENLNRKRRNNLILPASNCAKFLFCYAPFSQMHTCELT